MNSRLPLETKRAVFLKTQNSPNSWHPFDVTKTMLAFDRDASRIRFHEFLTRCVRRKVVALDDINVYLPGVLSLAFQVDDPECWNLYRKCLRFYHVHGRADLANECFRDGELPLERQSGRERIRCMLELIGDDGMLEKEANDAPNEFAQQFGYWAMPLSDFVALKLAGELDISFPWKADRTPAEWAELRDRVRKAAEAELAKK